MKQSGDIQRLMLMVAFSRGGFNPIDSYEAAWRRPIEDALHPVEEQAHLDIEEKMRGDDE